MKYLGQSLALFLTLFLVFSVENSIGELIPVKASYGSLGLTQAILPIGTEAGMFKESGLNVEPIYIAGRAVLALVGGDVQFSMMGGPPAILARLGGADLVILGGANTLNQILVSSPSIKDPKDLIGKKGGISRFGTTADYSMRIALKKFGLTADRDVTLIQIGDSAARLGGLKSGAISVAVMNSGDEPLAKKLGLKVLADFSDVPFPGSVIVTREALIRKNPEMVRRFMRGVVSTLRLIKTKPDETRRLLKRFYRELDDALAAELYKTLVNIFPGTTYVTEEAVKVVLDILSDKGELKKSVEPSEFLNVSFLREAAEVEKTR